MIHVASEYQIELIQEKINGESKIKPTFLSKNINKAAVKTVVAIDTTHIIVGWRIKLLPHFLTNLTE